MKKLLPISILLILSHLALGQLPSLNMTLQDQWDPDTLPTASGREYNDIWGYTDCSGNEYAIVGSASMVHFFDINDPQNIEELAYFPGGQVTTWRDIKTFRDRAFAVSDNTSEGLMIFDLSNIQDTIIKTYHSADFFGKSHNIYIDEENGRLYATGTTFQVQGLVILDIATNPDNPILLASIPMPAGGYVHDIYVKNNIAYCSQGYDGFFIWDFTIPTNPVLIADVETGGYNHSSWVTADGNYAIYAEEVPIGMPLGVIDLTDMVNGNIEVVHTFKFPLLAPNHEDNRPHNPFIRGNYLIVSYYHDGVQIFDISDPLNPVQVAYYDTFDNDAYNGFEGCWGVYPFFQSETIIASDINEGLLVLKADSIDFAPVSPNLTPDAEIVSNVPSPFCEGETALLTVESGAENYQWFKNDQPFGINQNFIFVDSTGDYKVEISNGQCFATSEVISLETQAGPDLSSLPSGEFEICENESILVEAPDNLDQYIWLKDGNVYQQGGNTLEINEAGNFSLLAYLAGCSSTSEVISATILELPQATILNQILSFCEGDELSLEANDGADLYVWYWNGNEIGSTTVNYQTISNGGNYQVEVTLNGCSKLSSEVEITEYELPDVNLSVIGLNGAVDSDSIHLCYGSSFVLAVPSEPNAQYEWFKNGQPAGNNTNTLQIADEGEYYVTVMTENDCSDQSIVMQVSISHPVAYIEFNSGILTNMDQWASYQWYMDGNIINGATDHSYTPTASGEYYCIISDEYGCESVSNYVQVSIDGLDEITSLTAFSMFPNPVDDILNIQLESSESLDFEIQILSSNGQLITHKDFEISGVQSLSFNLNNLASGVYLIRFKSETGQLVKRFVKM